MSNLQFKGKNIIWNHHLSIPYHTLDEVPKLDYQADKTNDNLIIEGDNLLALKALLPIYSGRVKYIYILYKIKCINKLGVKLWKT